MQTLLLTLCAAAVAHAAPTADRVASLPGWDKPLKSDMYSGYVEAEGMQVHYLFLQSEKTDNATFRLEISDNECARAHQTAPTCCSHAQP